MDGWVDEWLGGWMEWGEDREKIGSTASLLNRVGFRTLLLCTP